MTVQVNCTGGWNVPDVDKLVSFLLVFLCLRAICLLSNYTFIIDPLKWRSQQVHKYGKMYYWTRRLSNSTVQISTAVTLKWVAESTAREEQTNRLPSWAARENELYYRRKWHWNAVSWNLQLCPRTSGSHTAHLKLISSGPVTREDNHTLSDEFHFRRLCKLCCIQFMWKYSKCKLSN